MEEVVVLYDAVFMSFLESFSPEIDEAFSILENQVAQSQNNSQKLDDILQTILTDFPQLDSKYREIISTLTSFASSNPVSILTNLCTRFKNELKRSSDQPPATLIITSLSFKPTNFHHFQFHRYLTMIIITDLINSIYKEFQSKEPVPIMVSCGSTLCMAQEKLRPLHMQLINKWADIFHLISLQSLDEISRNFDRHSDDDSTTNIYYLDSKIVPNSEFIHYVLSSFQQNKKHKTLNSEMMSALSSLLATAKCEESTLEDFYQIAWNAKKTSSLKAGAIDLICVLLNRIQTPQKKLVQFYQKRVFKHTGDDSKLERSARAFLTLIRGDISRVNSDSDPHYFETVGNNISQESFANIFMKSFFENSNFKICPLVFGEILAHLASIDIKEFEKVVLHPFLAQNVDTFKIVSLLNAITIINSDSFLQHSICMAKQESLTSINRLALPILLGFLKNIQKISSNKHLILPRDILQFQSTIDECDNVVIEFLTQNNFLNFEPANFNSKGKPIERSQALLALQAIRAIPYLANSHMITSSMVELFVRFMCNSNFIISSAANDAYKKLIENKDHKVPIKFANKCISILLKTPDEVSAKCLSLLLDMVKNFKFSKSFYSDLEATVLCCFVKENPFCRVLALSILKHLSATNMGFIYKILHEKSSTISETINHLINVLNVPEKPSMNRPPLGFIDIEHACCSRYNNLWLIFLSEIFSTLIDCDCIKFLHKCRRIVQPLINETIAASLATPACPKSSSMSTQISIASASSSTENSTNTMLPIDSSQNETYSNLIPKSSSMLASNSQLPTATRSISNPQKLTTISSSSKQNLHFSSFTTTAINMLYIDSFAFEIKSPGNINTQPTNIADKQSNAKDKESSENEEKAKKEKRKHHKHRKGSLNKNNPPNLNSTENENEDNTDTDTDNEADNDADNDNDTQNLTIEKLFQTILSHSDYGLKRNLVHTFCLLNWRLIPYVLPYILSIDDYLAPEAAAALSFIIQSPENFNHIISSIFRHFINFLSLLQGYFIQLKINSTRKINWDEEHLSLLQEHKDLCVNYCILISAAFNNIPGQISEEDFPLPNRQVLVQFLTHWAQLPPEFEQVRSYAINALIPIIHAGTVFTDGFIFELPMLEMLTQCQLNGYPVLDSLLLFHLDILLDEFVKSAFLRPKREAQLFLEAIISALEYCDDSSVLQTHVGSLILLAMFYAQDQEAAAEHIMLKIASLFLDKSRDLNNNNNINAINLRSTKPISTQKKRNKKKEIQQRLDDAANSNSSDFENNTNEESKSILAHDQSSSILYNPNDNEDNNEDDESDDDEEDDNEEEEEEEEEHEDMSPDNIVSKYQFATEQVIDSGFEILRISTKVTVSKSISTILSYFFEKVRILPTHSFIVQGIPSKFRKFTIMSFFDTMYSVSSSLNDEYLDIFSTLWQNLLHNSDNNVVILLCLFESDKSEIKEKIFTQLLEKDPAVISKYLANRCTFAYWYFLRTDRQLNVHSITWMLRVLTRAFTSFIPDSVPNYTIAFHFSLLFIEEAEDLFEALLGVLNLDSVNSQFIWSIDPSNGSIFAASLVHAIVGIFKEQKQEAIDKWSLEAIRWAVACCDIKIGFRSLVIFNALETILPEQYIHLLIRAVLYHLSRVTEDDCDEVALFVGECFLVFQTQLDKKDVITVASKFATLFLKCPAFEKDCLKRAMPIFLSCLDSPVLKSTAKSMLSDAFVPFLRNIENDDDAQNLLKEIVTNSDVPELLLVVACFLLKPLPFVPIKNTYKDIISSNLTQQSTIKALELFSVMLKTASPELIDSIFQVSTAIIQKFENTLESTYLLSIYNIAVQKVAEMKSAVAFITSLMKFYPGVASLSTNDFEEKMYIDDIRHGLNKLLQDASFESVPITNCEQITQLCGMIDQRNPPKILPYSSQYEMYVGLRKNPTIEKKKLIKKWSSTLSLTSGILSNRSLILPASIDGNDFSKIEFAELPMANINKKFLDIPGDENGSWRFVVSAKEFLELAE